MNQTLPGTQNMMIKSLKKKIFKNKRQKSKRNLTQNIKYNKNFLE